MIKSSLFVKCLCVAVASVFVAGAASLRNAPQTVTLDGGGETVEAALGTSFADMSIGTLAALTPEKSVTPVPVTAAQSPVVTATATAPTPQPSLPVTATPLRAATPTLSTTTPAPSTATAPALKTLSAAPEARASPQQSSRPKQRDPVLAAKAAPKPVAKPKAKQAKKPKPEASGKSKQRAKQGTATGTKKVRAASKGKKKATTRSGNSAAAAKYPNQVMRRIARVSKPRVNSRGTAVVAFSVSGSGGLARLSIARSSGSSKLDQAALRVIKKAAPFPAPPRGAQRSFSIRIKGR